MQLEIGTQVDIGKNVSAFESIGHVPLTRPLILTRLILTKKN